MAFYLKSTFYTTLYLSILAICLFSCTDSSKNVDLEGIEIQIDINRFEKELFEKANPTISNDELNALKKDYPTFFNLFSNNIMKMGGINDSMTLLNFNKFTSDTTILSLYRSVLDVYPDLSDIQKQLNDAFKYYNYYFPQKNIPNIVSFLSAFNYAMVADDSLLAIGLDMYLGADNKYYPQLGIPQYRFKNMRKEKIVSDAMLAWLSTEYEEPKGENLLKQMVFHGKIQYVLSLLLPHEDVYLNFGYSEKQWEWCLDNESNIWGFMINQEMLYTNDNFEIRKFLGEGPFTAGFPEEAPAKLGQFIGYQIVQQFMKKSPQTTVEGLLEMDDAQTILNISNYKPNK